MKRIFNITLFLLCSVSLLAQREVERGTVVLDEITVTAKRLLSAIGVQQTVIDSVSLRQNITQSIGDVLSQNSTLFIKSYGRATLSTASFRGTAPSHTQVTWNGIKLNSPMLGQVDFSLIPSFFIDKADLYHGASSTGVTWGGLGGAVSLATTPAETDGFMVRYIQGVSSYHTFDEFLHFTYAGSHWKSSTRFLYSTSDNNYKYTNYHKMMVVTDEEGNKIDSYYPVERNKNGGFNDWHLMQEVYYSSGKGTRIGIYGWYMDSDRGVPMLANNYSEENEKQSTQHERTLRTGLNWDKTEANGKYFANAGYTYTDLNYLYLADPGNGVWQEMVRSQSCVNTASIKGGGEYFIRDRWMLAANVAAYQHYVKSEDKASGDGYKKARPEVLGFLSLRYTPVEGLGIAVNLREEYYGGDFTPVIPALFADYLLSKKGNVMLKASIARNFRYPTLNDLYFVPGGNDSLKTEKGYTYDSGISFAFDKKKFKISGEVTAFNSWIKDWIIWLPTFKGFWSPSNVKKVNSYGMEVKGKLAAPLGNGWLIDLNGNFGITHSINYGDPAGWADNSIGKQLVYIPRYSSGVTGTLSWRQWVFTYRWNYYSRRYTTSSNEVLTRRDVVGAYVMNDISLEKQWENRWGVISMKAVVNNLFGEAYESVLSRPMPGRNYGMFVGLVPNIKKRSR